MPSWFVRFAPLLLWMAVIFGASAQPALPTVPHWPLVDVVAKKFAHVVAYTFLMVLALRALRPAAGVLDTIRTIGACAFTVAYAISDEVHQAFVPGRTARWYDVAVFDLAGVCMGYVLWFRPRLVRHRSPMAWLYWLLCLASIVLIAALNIPFRGRPAQTPALLFGDPLFIWAFCYFGLLSMGITLLIIEDACARHWPWLPFVVPYIVLGVVPLSLYLALRPTPPPKADPHKASVLRLLSAWIWWMLPLMTLAISCYFLPQSSISQHRATLQHNAGWVFMWFDIAFNHILVLPLLMGDMARRNVVGGRKIWLAAVLLTGPIALGAYLATRPGPGCASSS
jgi:VanZ family protein